MPDCKDRDAIAINMVSRHITIFVAFYRPFPKLLGQVFHRPAEMGLGRNYPQPIPNGLGGTPGRPRVFRPEKCTQPLQVSQGSGDIDYLWHSGADCSLSEPQLSSQASTSSAVA